MPLSCHSAVTNPARAASFATFHKRPLTMPLQRSSTKAPPEPTLRDLMTIIKGMHRRLDVLEEQHGIHNTPWCINMRHKEKEENQFHREIAVMPKSSSILVYDEPIYDDDNHSMEDSLKIKHIDVLASVDSNAEGVSPSPTEDLLEILRSEMPYVKRSRDILSLESDQDTPSVEELLSRNSESNQQQLSLESKETHKEPVNASTAILEGPVVDLRATSVHNSSESPIISSAGGINYDLVIGDLLCDLHRPQVHKFWGSYMNSQVAPQDFYKYYPQEHALRGISKNFTIWVRVRKKKVSADSLSRLRHAMDEIDVAFDEGDVSPTRGE